MNEFIMREYLTKKQQKLFDKLDDVTKYECTCDRQAGYFGVGRVLTIKGWVDQAFQWLDSDEYFEEDQIFVNELLKGGQHAIDEIDEFWEITITKCIELEQASVDSAIEHWNNVCDREWGGHDLALGLIDDIENNDGAGCLDIEFSEREKPILNDRQKDYIHLQCFKLRPYVSEEGYTYGKSN